MSINELALSWWRSARRQQSRREHNNVRIIGQTNALPNLRRVEHKSVGIQAEGSPVLLAVAKIPVRHGNAFRLARIILRSEPVAQALHKLRTRSVGVIDREGLRCLISLYPRP